MKFSGHEVDEILRENRELKIKFEKASAELENFRQSRMSYYTTVSSNEREIQRLQHQVRSLRQAVARWKDRAGVEDEYEILKTVQRWEYNRETGEMGWKEYRTYTVDCDDIMTTREQLSAENGDSLLSLEVGQGAARYTLIEWL